MNAAAMPAPTQSNLVKLRPLVRRFRITAGTYVVEMRPIEVEPTRRGGVRLPLVHVGLGFPGDSGKPEFTTGLTDQPLWWGPKGGRVVVRLPADSASIVLSAYWPEDVAPIALDLSVRRVRAERQRPAVAPAITATQSLQSGPTPPPWAERRAAGDKLYGDASFASFIEQNGLFDAAFYRMCNRDLASSDTPLALHYVQMGDREGRRPNPYFDPVWYTKKYHKAPPPHGALRDYVTIGENLGRKPCALFEPAWYAAQYAAELNGQSPLAHYLKHRQLKRVSPNQYFDVDHYMRENSYLQELEIDPFEHWYNWGINHNRKGSALFNADYVRQRYLNDNRSLNPFEVFMEVGAELGWDVTGRRPEREHRDPYRELKKFSAPGPLFEELAPVSRPALDSDVKVLAFYLPQFHAIPENDAWWGAGFTEWRNIPRTMPRFAGHYQPRIPRDLGYYDLGSIEAMRRQVDLARRIGLSGFCFYYYNFNGHRLLERPVDCFLDDRSVDFPFCLIWANENWTRRWDGHENDILIRQDYRTEDVAALVGDFARHMRDPRYIRVAGRPLLFVYRADIIPGCTEAVEAWRRCFRDEHELDPLIVMAQTFGLSDPLPHGFDGALEFPPHNVASGLELLNSKLEVFDIDFSGYVYDYDAIVEASLAIRADAFPLIKTAFPSWDNDARKQGSGLSVTNSTPQRFQHWLTGLMTHARAQPFFGEPIVCVNAWNEWCEGAYLEPDVHFGYAYGNAVARALEHEAEIEAGQASRPRRSAGPVRKGPERPAAAAPAPLITPSRGAPVRRRRRRVGRANVAR